MTPCQNIVFYDAECLLCTSSVKFILSRDRKERICMASLKSPVYHKLNPEAGEGMEDTVVLYDGEEFHTKAGAVFRILALLPYPWKALAFFRYLPVRMTDFLYDAVAARRKKWFEPMENCWLPPEKVRARIL